jgi:hypothetical protein
VARRALASHLLDEHFRVEGRRTWFETLEEMQSVLDQYLVEYNTTRPHQGRGMKPHPDHRFYRWHQKGDYTAAKPDPKAA